MSREAKGRDVEPGQFLFLQVEEKEVILDVSVRAFKGEATENHSSSGKEA